MLSLLSTSDRPGSIIFCEVVAIYGVVCTRYRHGGRFSHSHSSSKIMAIVFSSKIGSMPIPENQLYTADNYYTGNATYNNDICHSI